MDINVIMEQLAQYQRMQEEVNAVLETLKDTVKAYMQEHQLETLIGSEHKAVYKVVVSARVDTTALKKDLPDVAAKYTKQQETKRFTFA